MQGSGRIKVADLNQLLTCVLCKGYYIDATTIVECLHSFCRTCIVKYLQNNKYCPTCEVQVHKTKPLKNIRADQTLQDIVYKVVPGLFKNEMKRRRDFYSKQDELIQGSIPVSSEKRGDIWGCDRIIFTPEDIISISLEYCPIKLPLPLNFPTNVIQSHRRFLRCPAAVTVFHLKKFLRAKYGLIRNKKLEILYMHDILKDQYTLIDLAYIYAWKRNGPLRLFYKDVEEPSPHVPKLIAETENCIRGVASEVNATCLLSARSTIATAPASRHPSPPPSPQMAAEPRIETIEEVESSSLLNAKLHNAIAPKVRSIFKFSPYVLMKDVNDYQRCYSGTLSEVSDIPKKKHVRFSVDLVQTFCENPSQKIFRTSQVNKPVINIRNSVFVSERHS